MYNIKKIELHEENKPLQKIADQLYLKYFHHKLHCKVRFSTLYTCQYNSAGVTYYADYYHPAIIYINPYNAEEYGNKCAIAIIKHELIHYYLWKIKDTHGSGHTKRFHQIARKIGADGTYVPFSLKYPICRKEFRERYYKPVYFYYSYKVGVYWEFYHMYTGDHIRDSYDKKRCVHYLGFTPTYAVFKVIKDLRHVYHEYSFLRTDDLVRKLMLSPDLNYMNGCYHKYIHQTFQHEVKIEDQKKFLKIFRKIASDSYYHSESSDSKLQTIANLFYMYYFHQKLNCNVFFNPCDAKTTCRFYIRNNYPCIRVMPWIDPDPYIYSLSDEQTILTRLKISLVHYYLWSTRNSNGYKYTKDFYRIVKEKFNVDLIPSNHPHPFKKDYRESYSYLYYSYGLGLYWRTNEMKTGDYAYDQHGKSHKVYYIDGCDRECFQKCWSKLVQGSNQYLKNNLNTAQIVPKITKMCASIIKKTEHQTGIIKA